MIDHLKWLLCLCLLPAIGNSGLLAQPLTNSEAAPLPLPEVPAGFKIELVAREPLVRNPCAMAFDKRGKLFIGMGPQYRHPTPDTPGDSVVLLTDSDGDGLFDESRPFATGFNCIQGLAWHGRDLWVANAPDLTVVRDLDGDDLADQYIRVYTDLGNLEHGLHGLNWAPDGKLYMSKGNSKGLTQPGRIAPRPFRELWGVSAPPGSPDFPSPQQFDREDYRRTFHDPSDDWGREGGVLRCDDMGANLEIVTRGLRNPWDIGFDSGFHWQGTDNDQNQGDRVFMPFFGAHFGWGHSWSAHWTGANHPPTVPSSGPTFHGSGTGIVFYDAPQFPPAYRRVWFFNDWLRRTTFVYHPRWEGALLQPQEGAWQEFVRGGDALFRPTDLAAGPQGALYILGWGSEEGARWSEKGEQDNEGRVFRISHGRDAARDTASIARDEIAATRRVGSPRAGNSGTGSRIGAKRGRPLSNWSFAELIDDFNSPLPVWQTNAQQELVRRGPACRDQLMVVLKAGKLSESQETWTAWTLGRVSPDDSRIEDFFAELAADNRSELLNLRLQALRILAYRVRQFGRRTTLPLVVEQSLADDEPRVRFEAVQALRLARQHGSVNALYASAATESDRVTYYALWQAIRQLVSIDVRRSLLRDSRAGIRRAALLSLTEEGALDAADVTALLSDDDRATRNVAALWLSKKDGNPLLVIDPPGSEFHDAQQVHIVAGLKPSDIHYTTDGSVPTENSPILRDPITLTETTTLRASLFVKGQSVGPPSTAVYRKLTAQEAARRSGIVAVRPASSQPYRVVTNGLRLGQEAYTDHNDKFAAVPDQLRGATIIQTANRDAGSQGESFLEIETVVPVTLFLGHDTRLSTKPAWLAEEGDAAFAATDLHVETKKAKFALYQRRFDAGRLVLGGNTSDGSESGCLNYLVILIPAGLQPLEQPTLVTDVLPLLQNANTEHGRALFFAEGAASCSKCHRTDGSQPGFGPDLLHLVKGNDPVQVVRSILKPSAKITEGFAMQTVLTEEGRTVNGLLREETATSLTLILPEGKTVTLLKESIEERISQHVSPMPPFDRILTPNQLADLAAWLLSTKEPQQENSPNPASRTAVESETSRVPIP
jgi:putative membrane-bound dehydrogenase-like protein